MVQKSCNKTLWKKGGFSHQLAKYLPSQVPLHLRSPKQQSPRAHLWGLVALLPWTSLLRGHIEKPFKVKKKIKAEVGVVKQILLMATRSQGQPTVWDVSKT